MKKIFMLPFFIFCFCIMQAADAASLEPKSFGIIQADVDITSGVYVDKPSVVSRVLADLKGNFKGYKIVEENVSTAENTDVTGATINASKKDAKENPADWYIHVEILSIGTVYPIAYSVRVSFVQKPKLYASTIGYANYQDFNDGIYEAIDTTMQELANLFIKSKSTAGKAKE